MQHQHKEHDLEKPNEQYLERTGTETGSTRSPVDNGNGNVDYPGKGSDMEKRLLRRIDLRLVPALGESIHAPGKPISRHGHGADSASGSAAMRVIQDSCTPAP